MSCSRKLFAFEGALSCFEEVTPTRATTRSRWDQFLLIKKVQIMT